VGFLFALFYKNLYPNNTPKPYKIKGYKDFTQNAVDDTSIKIRRNRRKTTVSNPKKADQQKSLNCFFKTMAFSHTDQLNQLDPTNEREPPLKLTPYSP
jgi:hypothetical protein